MSSRNRGESHPFWRRYLASLLDRPLPAKTAPVTPHAEERRSAVQIYLDGGGDPENEQTMALLREADRPLPSHLMRSDGAIDLREGGLR